MMIESMYSTAPRSIRTFLSCGSSMIRYNSLDSRCTSVYWKFIVAPWGTMTRVRDSRAILKTLVGSGM